MPKNNDSDVITDQEMAFARLVLSGTMTDRQAAEAVGLDPDSAAGTLSRPCVRGYMLGHKAAVEQQLQQDTQELPRFNVGRDQVLTLLWEIANMEPERTRNSMSSQVKAISMIVAIEGLIPDRHSARRADSARNQPGPTPDHPPFYVSAWARKQQNGESVDPQPSPVPAQEDGQQDARQEAGPELRSAPGWANDPSPTVSGPTPEPCESIFPGLEHLANDIIAPSRPYVRYVPDARGPFSINKKFGPPR